MNQEQIERYISKARLDAYSSIEEYSQNLLFSRHFYIPLAILEVALRNSINDYLTAKVGDKWLDNETLLCKDARRKIAEAKKQALMPPRATNNRQNNSRAKFWLLGRTIHKTIRKLSKTYRPKKDFSISAVQKDASCHQTHNTFQAPHRQDIQKSYISLRKSHKQSRIWRGREYYF